MVNSTRRKLLKSMGVAAVSTSLISKTTAAHDSTSTASPTVSKEEARRTAQTAVRRLSRQREYYYWDADSLSDPSLYYAKVERGSSTKYVPRAWVFPLTGWNRDLGYITIDAAQTEQPVLSFGKSPAPQRKISRATKVAQETGASVLDAERSSTDKPRLLYYGGVNYAIETSTGTEVSLRGEYVKETNTVSSAEALQPNKQMSSNGDVVTISGGEVPDWSGPTDDEIWFVPDWTQNGTEGDSRIRKIGPGPDSWDEWDGCVPIAGTNVLGYHENISDSNEVWRERTIDRLHILCLTDDDGNTYPQDVAKLDKWDHGKHNYDATTKYTNIRGNTVNAVSKNNPPILSMVRGPYSKEGKFTGHAVVVVGYEIRSNDFWPGDSIYYKVHNGRNEPGPDEVAGGNWTNAQLTRVQKQY